MADRSHPLATAISGPPERVRGAFDRTLPSAGPEREALRQKGQFWTPDWVAEAMVAYALQGSPDHLFDPAVGGGAFLRAAKTVARESKLAVRLLGAEIDPLALRQARESGLSDADLAQVQIADFVLAPPDGMFKAVVANPPYIRHHRLPAETKARLRQFAASLTGSALDGRAGLHIYFLLRGLERLDRGGRLAFIIPADTCEGVFAPPLWQWIAARFRIDAVVTFAPGASPFPGVDTNPLIVLIQNAQPARHFWWATCSRGGTRDLRRWIASGFAERSDSLIAIRREVAEGVHTGLSRPPAAPDNGPVLGDFASVMRGIASGDNAFFLLTHAQASALAIPAEFLRPAIARTRDARDEVITPETLRALEAKGRPTLLFAPDGRPLSAFPEAVRRYLAQGEATGVSQRKLIATRRPWYRMESRAVPPILFAYLGRRHARFLRNRAGVVPLTGFLAVYPFDARPEAVERLWEVLRDPQTVAHLARVGKSYGDGAIKVEPRALERLPLPLRLVRGAGL